jgi:hypothetical protein
MARRAATDRRPDRPGIRGAQSDLRPQQGRACGASGQARDPDAQGKARGPGSWALGEAAPTGSRVRESASEQGFGPARPRQPGRRGPVPRGRGPALPGSNLRSLRRLDPYRQRPGPHRRRPDRSRSKRPETRPHGRRPPGWHPAHGCIIALQASVRTGGAPRRQSAKASPKVRPRTGRGVVSRQPRRFKSRWRGHPPDASARAAAAPLRPPDRAAPPGRGRPHGAPSHAGRPMPPQQDRRRGDLARPLDAHGSGRCPPAASCHVAGHRPSDRTREGSRRIGHRRLPALRT